MNSSQMLRVTIAAVMYLLLVWGYLTLQTPQWFAVFAALVMSITLLYWVSEGRLDVVQLQQAESENEPAEILDVSLSAGCPDDEPTLNVSLSRLESLKSELNQQYAQFGRDQSLINSNGLGLWHGTNRQGRSDR